MAWVAVAGLLALSGLCFGAERIGNWWLKNGGTAGTVMEPGPRLQRSYLGANRWIGRLAAGILLIAAVGKAVSLL